MFSRIKARGKAHSAQIVFFTSRHIFLLNHTNELHDVQTIAHDSGMQLILN